MTLFNCWAQAQYCPHREETDVTVGPFVVWPKGFKPDGKIEKTNGLFTGTLHPFALKASDARGSGTE